MLSPYVELTDRSSVDELAATIAAIRTASAAFREATRFTSPIRFSLFRTENGITRGQYRGVTEDVSETGMGTVLDEALRVGDDYWVAFDRSTLNIEGLTQVRCVRCRLLDQNRFETGFRFYNAITMPQSVRDTHDDDILG